MRQWSFSPRNPKDIFEKVQFDSETLRALRALPLPMIFGISSGDRLASDNKTPSPPYYGMTAYLSAGPFVLVTLSKSLLLPLFRKDLNTSEILLQQFSCVSTLLHEFAVKSPV